MAAGRPNDFLTKKEARDLIESQISLEWGFPIVTGKGFAEYLEALFIREYFCTEEQFKKYSERQLTDDEIKGGFDEAIEQYKFLSSKIDQDVIRWKNNLNDTNNELLKKIEAELKERIECAHLYGDVPILLGKFFKDKGINNNLGSHEIAEAFASGVPFDWILDRIQINVDRMLVTAKTTQEHIDKINEFIHNQLKIDAAILPLSFDLNGVVFGRLNNTKKFAYLFNELNTTGFIRNDWQRCVSLGIAIKAQKTDIITPKGLSKELSKANEEQFDRDKIDEYKQIKKFVEDLQEFR